MLKLFQRQNLKRVSDPSQKADFQRFQNNRAAKKKISFSNNFSVPPREGPIRGVNLRKRRTEFLFSENRPIHVLTLFWTMVVNQNDLQQKHMFDEHAHILGVKGSPDTNLNAFDVTNHY